MNILKVISHLQKECRRSMTLYRREMFFEEIMKRFTAPIDTAGRKFGQAELLEAARIKTKIIDNNVGLFMLEVETDFSGFKGTHSYAMTLAGDLLKINLQLYGGLEKAPLVDWQNEIQTIWPGCAPNQQDREDLTMYEWTFFLPDIYENFATQERYTLGLTHMHCRILRIIRDYRILQKHEDSVVLPT